MSRQIKPHIVNTARGRRTLSRPRSGTTRPRPPSTPAPPKLTQRTYPHFTTPIQIFHYASSFLSLASLRTLLQWNNLGYVTRLLSSDPLSGTAVVQGDEVPRGCVEVVYLEDSFWAGGSALGFRSEEGKDESGRGDGREGVVVEWLVFRDSVPEFVLHDINIPWRVVDGEKKCVNSGKLFNHVACISKFPESARIRKTKEGRELDRGEYCAWWDALQKAGHPRVRVLLSWKNWGRDVGVFLEGQRVEREKESEALEDEGEEDEGQDDEDEWDEEEMEMGREVKGGDKDAMSATLPTPNYSDADGTQGVEGGHET